MKFLATVATLLAALGLVESQGCPSVCVRREWGTLSQAERNAYVNAVIALNNRPSQEFPGLSVFSGLVRKHATFATQGGGLATHNSRLFLVWHRMFVDEYEDLLRQVNPSVCAHYWAFDRFAFNPSSSNVWAHLGRWPTNGTINTGPFTGWTIAHPNTHQIRRGVAIDQQTNRWLATEEWTNYVQNQNTYGTFVDRIENGHNGFHGIIGGAVGDMNSFATSAGDPIFWLFHSAIERFHVQWQLRRNIFAGFYGANSNVTVPGYNISIETSLDFRRFCYSYDTPIDDDDEESSSEEDESSSEDDEESSSEDDEESSTGDDDTSVTDDEESSTGDDDTSITDDETDDTDVETDDTESESEIDDGTVTDYDPSKTPLSLTYSLDGDDKENLVCASYDESVDLPPIVSVPETYPYDKKTAIKYPGGRPLRPVPVYTPTDEWYLKHGYTLAEADQKRQEILETVEYCQRQVEKGQWFEKPSYKAGKNVLKDVTYDDVEPIHYEDIKLPKGAKYPEPINDYPLAKYVNKNHGLKCRKKPHAAKPHTAKPHVKKAHPKKSDY